MGKRLLEVEDPTVHFSLATGWLAGSDDVVRPLRRQRQMIIQDPLSSLHLRKSILRSAAGPLIVHEGLSGRTRRERAGLLALLAETWYEDCLPSCVTGRPGTA